VNLSLLIARRYFLSGKKKNFINVISMISMAVVSIGTASLIIALSVFNGLEGLLKSMYGNFDPDIVIGPSEGKSFVYQEKDFEKIESIKGIKGVSRVIEDNVLLKYKDAQRVVRMKGVDRAFDEFSGIQHVMVTGDFGLVKDSVGYALIGRGVQYDLSINLSNDLYALRIYYPGNIGPGIVNPERTYNVLDILPGGVFAIEKYYDENYIFVPIELAEDLFNYNGKLTAYELYLEEGANPEHVKADLMQHFGSDFFILKGDELHSDLYKILKIEKLFVFLILIAIIGIASINIYFSLAMLVIEKQKDLTILFVQGAGKKLIRNIFILEGCIIAFSGAVIGLILGLGISLIQQEYGVIGMGIHSAVMNSYPVKIHAGDIVVTVLAIVIITLIASLQPAVKAGNTYSASVLQ